MTPSHIVGAVANEIGLESRYIGRIQLYDKHSTVDLPRGMPRQVLQHLQKVRIFQQPLAIQRDTEQQPPGQPGRPSGRSAVGKPKRFGKGKKFGGKTGLMPGPYILRFKSPETASMGRTE